MINPFFLSQLNKQIWNFRRKFSPISDYDFNSEGEIVHNYRPITWTRFALFELILSGCIGGIVGVFISVVINGTFIELILSSTFSMVKFTLNAFIKKIHSLNKMYLFC